MTKIRLILNLPRCGGTLFARIIQAHSDVTLLSEVHPSQGGRGLFAKLQAAGRQPGFSPNASWNDALEQLRAVEDTLVLRDHTHVNFTSPNPNYHMETLVNLRSVGDVSVLALLRDPVDEYLSCLSRAGLRRYLTPAAFAKGYAAYNAAIQDLPTLRYEDLVADPEASVRFACEALDLSFQPQMLENFNTVTSVSGDGDQPSRAYHENKVVDLPKREGWAQVRDVLSTISPLVETAQARGYSL